MDVLISDQPVDKFAVVGKSLFHIVEEENWLGNNEDGVVSGGK